MTCTDMSVFSWLVIMAGQQIYFNVGNNAYIFSLGHVNKLSMF